MIHPYSLLCHDQIAMCKPKYFSHSLGSCLVFFLDSCPGDQSHQRMSVLCQQKERKKSVNSLCSSSWLRDESRKLFVDNHHHLFIHFLLHHDMMKRMEAPTSSFNPSMSTVLQENFLQERVSFNSLRIQRVVTEKIESLSNILTEMRLNWHQLLTNIRGNQVIDWWTRIKK